MAMEMGLLPVTATSAPEVVVRMGLEGTPGLARSAKPCTRYKYLLKWRLPVVDGCGV